MVQKSSPKLGPGGPAAGGRLAMNELAMLNSASERPAYLAEENKTTDEDASNVHVVVSDLVFEEMVMLVEWEEPLW